MTSTSRHPLATCRAAAALLPFVLGIAACSPKEKPADTASASSAATPVAKAPDSASVPATTDADHDFLRTMSDHHKGLIALVHMTRDRSGVGTARADATTLDKARDAELDQMMTMLEKTYKDPYTPKVMPEHQAMAAALKPMSGKGYERTFYEDIVKHHAEAITMIDAYLPKAKRADIKAMAEKMKADQSREITAFQQKLAKLGA
jgi:uncharacterized protein (DUF305 family)